MNFGRMWAWAISTLKASSTEGESKHFFFVGTSRLLIARQLLAMDLVEPA